MHPAQPSFLGELELAVMDHLWSHDGRDAKDVHDAIGQDRHITLNTIQSTLKRLYEKGLLRRDKVSHAHVYQPALSREEFHRVVLQQVVEKMMGGRSEAMLSAFIGVTEEIGPEQLEQLEVLVAQRLASLRDGGED